MTKPLVSIIIPCYNAGPMIEKCLNSCLQQNYRPLEIIVVDNNSTDDSMTVAQRLKQQHEGMIKILSCPEPGAGRARNRGYREAKGEYIQWLDADDEIDSEKIQLQVTALEKERSFDIAYGSWDLCTYDAAKMVDKWSIEAVNYEDFLLELLVDNWRPTHSYLLRRSITERIHAWEGWTPVERVLQDRRYFSFAALLGAHFLAVPSARVVYNHWSSHQLGKGTALLARGPVLQRMAEGLLACHSRQPSVSLNESHEFLLNLSKGPWTPRSVEESRFKKCEVAVLNVLQNPQTYASLVPPNTSPIGLLEHWAILIVRTLWKMGPSFEQMDAAIGIRPRDGMRPSPLAAELIDASPMILPVLCEYRLPVLRILTDLCQKGCLVQV
jgi:hypothetical protein